MYRNLLAEMTRSGLTQIDIAKALGITPKSVSNKINGKTEFKLSDINTIKRLLPAELTFEYLFSDEGRAS